MNEEYEIKITVTYDGDKVNLFAKSNLVGTNPPSIFFMALSKFLNQQVLLGLQEKLAIADDIADLIVGIADSEVSGD
ncbi:hypothetical protein [Morganella psychrotolerans]|uniref:Uncharacterized protein n=1 Tax=Morganella psychrotolerans TaxID=368603 RepID=A0A1B8HTZ7_9GAMM|nr:hypothetical protein [Morganella psychrotolerans]OBU13344.1 hypothetical protein AYY18_00930 [Morganella psychrotolerans]